MASVTGQTSLPQPDLPSVSVAHHMTLITAMTSTNNSCMNITGPHI